MGPETERAGLGFAGLCVLSGAFVAPVARLSTEGGDALFVATATTLLAGLTAAVVLLAKGQLRSLVSGRDALPLVMLGALGTMIPNLLFFLGTARTSALDAVLCLQTEPAFSLLLAWLVLGHRLTLRRVFSVAVLLIGIVCAMTGDSIRDPLGISMLLAAPLAWQLSHLLVLRRLTGARPELLTGARYVWGGICLGFTAAVFCLVTDRPLLPASPTEAQLPLLALQGIVLSYCGTMLWYQAIARLDLARATAIIVPSIPVLTLVTAFVIVGEVPSLRQVVGLCIVAGGVLSFVSAPHAVETLERVPTQTAPLGADGGEEAGGDVA